MIKKYYFVLFFLLMGNQCFSQKPHVGSKDNPPVPRQDKIKITEPIRKFYGKKASKLLKNAKAIEAYHLMEGTKDKTGFRGYKVITKVVKLSEPQKKTLRSILFNPKSYVFDNVGKKCGFRPNIGFRFKSDKSNLDVLVALNCSVIRYAYRKTSKLEDCDPAHNPFLKLCRGVFPKAFEKYPNRQTTSGYRDDIPGKPAEGASLPSFSLEPVNQNNTTGNKSAKGKPNKPVNKPAKEGKKTVVGKKAKARQNKAPGKIKVPEGKQVKQEKEQKANKN